MSYRIYLYNYNKNAYEMIGVCTFDMMLEILDRYAESGDMPTILVIEHDIKNNSDTPYFRTPRLMEEYFEWRSLVDKIKDNECIKKY